MDLKAHHTQRQNEHCHSHFYRGRLPFRDTVSRKWERWIGHRGTTFVEVADAGGVSSAARRLGVTKSLVSRHRARLEAELGVQLLARTTRVAATDGSRNYVSKPCRQRLRRDRRSQRNVLTRGRPSWPVQSRHAAHFGPTHRLPCWRTWHDVIRNYISILCIVIASSIWSRNASIAQSGSAIFRPPT